MLVLSAACHRAIPPRLPPATLSCHHVVTCHFSTSVRRRPSHVSVTALQPFILRSSIKTKAIRQLDNVPQTAGRPPLPSAAPDIEGPAYPTVVLQARTNMVKFENCVLLTRVGGFYELYFEHADEFGPLLNLKVAQKKTSAGPVSMAGFPFFQLDRFLKILVQDLGRYVAIAEEFPIDAAARVKSGGLLHDRRVSRVITPGTLIDENFMDPYSSNYVLAIHVGEDIGGKMSPKLDPPGDMALLAAMPIGLAWLDLSTGHFYTQSTTLFMLSSVVSRVSPREIVLDENLREAFDDNGLFSILAEDRHLVTHCSKGHMSAIIDWNPMLEREVSPAEAAKFTAEEVSAGGSLLYYVETRLQGLNMKLQPPVPYRATENMIIDKSSMRALEIKKTIRDGRFQGTLSHAIRRTVTKSGTRLLDEWLSAPSTSLQTINYRLDLVGYMLGNNLVAERIVSLLRKSHDSQRLVQKFALNRGDADDLIAVANTILATQELVSILQKTQSGGPLAAESKECKSFIALLGRIDLDGPLSLAELVKNSIDENGIVEQHRMNDGEAGMILELAEQVATGQGSAEDIAAIGGKSQKKRTVNSIKEHYANEGDVWIMKPAASDVLGVLHAQLKELAIEKARLTEDLQGRLGASSLTLRWTPGLGHICHVKGKAKDKLDTTNLRSVSSTKSTRSFHQPEWTELGQRIDLIKLRVRAEEHQVFLRLREQVIQNLVTLRRNASVLDELDIACSLAKLAEEQSLVRPILNNSTRHKIISGRHPTVQRGLVEQGRSFITNDCFVGDQERLWLITGPNMAGKSTFLRQNALITVMAQIGSYVPAEYAEIGIVDQIFSRVGSADNLFRDQSTFMVEMLETATILKHATPRSFVIMDEIGRGTTPEDGTAVAFACLHHLCYINQCRTLFATHFHKLTEMSKDIPSVGYYCSDVAEDSDGGFSYVHKLRKGINRQSHALKVAKLAGLPQAAISIAHEVLEKAV